MKINDTRSVQIKIIEKENLILQIFKDLSYFYLKYLASKVEEILGIWIYMSFFSDFVTVNFKIFLLDIFFQNTISWGGEEKNVYFN